MALHFALTLHGPMQAQGREREAQLAALLSDNRRLVAQTGTLQQADQAMAQDLQKQRQVR